MDAKEEWIRWHVEQTGSVSSLKQPHPEAINFKTNNVPYIKITYCYYTPRGGKVYQFIMSSFLNNLFIYNFFNILFLLNCKFEASKLYINSLSTYSVFSDKLHVCYRLGYILCQLMQTSQVTFRNSHLDISEQEPKHFIPCPLMIRYI